MSSQLEHHRSRSAAPQAVTFDDRLWPVIAALVALAGCGGAVIWSVSNFDDPRWWANGWTYIGSLAAVTLLLIVALSLTDRARRAVQFAAVMSVILHILLFLSLNQIRLLALADDRLSRERNPDPVEEFRAPDYHLRADDAPQEQFEKPVETELPEEQPTDVERQELEPPEELPQDTPPTPEPGETPHVEPSVIPLQKLEQAAPRLAPTPSELSRAEPGQVELAPPSPVPAPALSVTADPAAPAPAEATPEQQQFETRRAQPRAGTANR